MISALGRGPPLPRFYLIYHTIGGLVNETVRCFSFGTGVQNSGVCSCRVRSAAPASEIASVGGMDIRALATRL